MVIDSCADLLAPSCADSDRVTRGLRTFHRCRDRGESRAARRSRPRSNRTHRWPPCRWRGPIVH